MQIKVKKTIKELPKVERPREKLMHYGPEKLSNSENDLTITKRLVEAGKIMGIEVVDHIIVVKNRYFSFKEKGLLQ